MPNDNAYSTALDEVEKSKQLVIHMPEMAKMPILNEIKEILSKYPGNTPVYLEIGFGLTAKSIKTHTAVTMDPSLIHELKNIKEISKIDVI